MHLSRINLGGSATRAGEGCDGRRLEERGASALVGLGSGWGFLREEEGVGLLGRLGLGARAGDCGM